MVRELGLDRHPELREEYFRHYTRVIWLAQRPTPATRACAEAAAARLGLPLEVREVGSSGLERELERLLEACPRCGVTCRMALGTRSGVSAPHRSFDPNRVGRLETVTWVSYYRREWLKFLRAAVLVTRHAFGLPWPATLQAAWLVLRANQLWAPQAHNDPDGARRAMRALLRAGQAPGTASAMTPRRRPGWRSSGGGSTASTSGRAQTSMSRR